MWLFLRWGGGIALAGLAAWLVTGQTDELSGASRYLGELRWWWMLLAVAAEGLSYLAFSSLQRVLLACGRASAGRGRMFGVALAFNALQNSLPAGAAFAAAFVYRQYRRLGADELVAAWTLVTQVVLSFASLSVLAVVGLFLALGTGSALDLLDVILGTAAVALLLVLAWWERAWLLDHSVHVVQFVQRVTRHPKGDAATLVADARGRIGAVAPDRRTWLRAGLYAVGNWVFDLGCLTLAFLAVGADIPWHGLLLAYAAAQLAATLPFTPGGLGVVEGSLTVALVTFGGAEASAVAAVLIYRIISFWAELPVGWVAWLAVGRHHRQEITRGPLALPVGVTGAGE
ncbi:MAG TPA: YbhN family protein [Acidimicrobiales bacterium]|nr:YbhN family protein [Acidimicrobiales bacterium]